MPTVAALAGLPLPAGVDGTDVSALLDNPDQSVKKAAYHQYPACGCDDTPAKCYNKTRGACNNTPRQNFNFMGYSVRVDEWRYTAWFKWLVSNSSNGTATYAADWDGPFAEELYDHKGDDSTEMDKFENVNLAASNPDVAKQLHAQLRSFFTKDGRGRVHTDEGSGKVDMSDWADM